MKPHHISVSAVPISEIETIGNAKETLMDLSLSDASKLAGVSKSALFKAMKRGVFSGFRDEVTGEWRVNITELQRVYALKDVSVLTEEPPQNDRVPSIPDSAIVSERIRALEDTLDQVKSERDDLRRRLDSETEERRRLTLMLTDQRPSTEVSAPVQRTPWILYVIGTSTLIAAIVAVLHMLNILKG